MKPVERSTYRVAVRVGVTAFAAMMVFALASGIAHTAIGADVTPAV